MKKIFTLALLLLTGFAPLQSVMAQESTEPVHTFEVSSVEDTQMLSFLYDEAVPFGSFKLYKSSGEELESGFIPAILGTAETVKPEQEDGTVLVGYIGSVFGDVSTLELAKANESSYYAQQFVLNGENIALEGSEILKPLESFDPLAEGLNSAMLSSNVTSCENVPASERLKCIRTGLTTDGLISDNNGINEQQLGILEGQNAQGGGNLLFLVTNIVNSVFMLLGFIAVILLILEGVLLILARGKDDKRKDIINTIVNIAIGFGVILLSYAIVTTILSVLGAQNSRINPQPGGQLSSTQQIARDVGVSQAETAGRSTAPAAPTNTYSEFTSQQRTADSYKTNYQEFISRTTEYQADYRSVNSRGFLVDNLIYPSTRGQVLDVMKSEWDALKGKTIGFFVENGGAAITSVQMWVSQTVQQYAPSTGVRTVNATNGTNPVTKATGKLFSFSGLELKEGVENKNIVHVKLPDGTIQYFTVLIRNPGEEKTFVFIPGQLYADYQDFTSAFVTKWDDLQNSGANKDGYDRRRTYYVLKRANGNDEERTFTTGGTAQMNPGNIAEEVEVSVRISDQNTMPSSYTKVSHQLTRADGSVISADLQNNGSVNVKVPLGQTVKVIDDISAITSDGKTVSVGTNVITLVNNAAVANPLQNIAASVVLDAKVLDTDGVADRRIFAGDFVGVLKPANADAKLPLDLKYYGKQKPTLIEFTSDGIRGQVVRFADAQVAKATSTTDVVGGTTPYQVKPELAFERTGTFPVTVSIRDYQMGQTFLTYTFTVNVQTDGTKLTIAPSPTINVGTPLSISTYPLFSENADLTAKRVEVVKIKTDGAGEEVVVSKSLNPGGDNYDHVFDTDGSYKIKLFNTFKGSSNPTLAERAVTVMPLVPVVDFDALQQDNNPAVVTIVDKTKYASEGTVFVEVTPADNGLVQSAWQDQSGKRVKTLTFSKPGSYRVIVSARNRLGQIATRSKDIRITTDVSYTLKFADKNGREVASNSIPSFPEKENFTVRVLGKNLSKVEVRRGSENLGTLSGPTEDAARNLVFTKEFKFDTKQDAELTFLMYNITSPTSVATEIRKTVRIRRPLEPVADFSILKNGATLDLVAGACEVAGVSREGYVVPKEGEYTFNAGASTGSNDLPLTQDSSNVTYRWKIGARQLSSSTFSVRDRFATVSANRQSCVPVELNLTEVVNGSPVSSTITRYVRVDNSLPEYSSFYPEWPSGVLTTPFDVKAKISGLKDPDEPGQKVQVTWFYEVDGQTLGNETSFETERTIRIANYGTPGNTYSFKVGALLKDLNTNETVRVVSDARTVRIGENLTASLSMTAPTLQGNLNYIPWVKSASNGLVFTVDARLSNGNPASTQIIWSRQRIGNFTGCQGTLESNPRRVTSDGGNSQTMFFDTCGMYRVAAEISYNGQNVQKNITVKVYDAYQNLQQSEQSAYNAAGGTVRSSAGPAGNANQNSTTVAQGNVNSPFSNTNSVNNNTNRTQVAGGTNPVDTIAQLRNQASTNPTLQRSLAQLEEDAKTKSTSEILAQIDGLAASNLSTTYGSSSSNPSFSWAYDFYDALGLKNNEVVNKMAKENATIAREIASLRVGGASDATIYSNLKVKSNTPSQVLRASATASGSTVSTDYTTSVGATQQQVYVPGTLATYQTAPTSLDAAVDAFTASLQLGRYIELPTGKEASLANPLVAQMSSAFSGRDTEALLETYPETENLSNVKEVLASASGSTLHGSADSVNSLSGYKFLDETALLSCTKFAAVMQSSKMTRFVCNDLDVFAQDLTQLRLYLNGQTEEIRSGLAFTMDTFDRAPTYTDKVSAMKRVYDAVDTVVTDATVRHEIKVRLSFVLLKQFDEAQLKEITSEALTTLSTSLIKVISDAELKGDTVLGNMRKKVTVVQRASDPALVRLKAFLPLWNEVLAVADQTTLPDRVGDLWKQHLEGIRQIISSSDRVQGTSKDKLVNFFDALAQENISFRSMTDLERAVAAYENALSSDVPQEFKAELELRTASFVDGATTTISEALFAASRAEDAATKDLDAKLSSFVQAKGPHDTALDALLSANTSILARTDVSADQKRNELVLLRDGAKGLAERVKETVATSTLSTAEKTTLIQKLDTTINTESIDSVIAGLKEIVSLVRDMESGLVHMYIVEDILDGSLTILSKTTLVETQLKSFQAAYSTATLQSVASLVVAYEGQVLATPESKVAFLSRIQDIALRNLIVWSYAAKETTTNAGDKEAITAFTGAIENKTFANPAELLNTLISAYQTFVGNSTVSTSMKTRMTGSVYGFFVNVGQTMQGSLYTSGLTTYPQLKTYIQNTVDTLKSSGSSVIETSRKIQLMKKRIMADASLPLNSKLEILLTIQNQFPFKDVLAGYTYCAPLYVKDAESVVFRSCMEVTNQGEEVQANQLLAYMQTALTEFRKIEVALPTGIASTISEALTKLSEDPTLPQDTRRALAAVILDNLEHASVNEGARALMIARLYTLPVISDDILDVQETPLRLSLAFGNQGELESKLKAVMSLVRTLNNSQKSVIRESLLQAKKYYGEDQYKTERSLALAWEVVSASSLNDEMKSEIGEILQTIGNTTMEIPYDMMSPEVSVANVYATVAYLARQDAYVTLQAEMSKLEQFIASKDYLSAAGFANNLKARVDNSQKLLVSEKEALSFNLLVVKEYVQYIAAKNATDSIVTIPDTTNENTNTATPSTPAPAPTPDATNSTPFLLSLLTWVLWAVILIIILACVLGVVLYISFIRYRDSHPDIHVDFEEYILLLRQRFTERFGHKEQTVIADTNFNDLPTKPESAEEDEITAVPQEATQVVEEVPQYVENTAPVAQTEGVKPDWLQIGDEPSDIAQPPQSEIVAPLPPQQVVQQETYNPFEDNGLSQQNQSSVNTEKFSNTDNQVQSDQDSSSQERGETPRTL